MKPALIIFQKNARKGEVKTRLARSVGASKALDIYQDLINITAGSCRPLEETIDIHIFYSTEIEENDVWSTLKSEKHIQLNSVDLGKRMAEAIERLWSSGYKRIGIIGTDCPYLTRDILSEAYRLLISKDVVIGPAMDGGFYFLGVNSLSELTFNDITWSTSSVLQKYRNNLKPLNKTIGYLTTLDDIDDETSFNRYKHHLNKLNPN